MQKRSKTRHDDSDFNAFDKEQLADICAQQAQQLQQLTQQLEWFKRQLFGQKSEKRNFEDVPQQLNMAEFFKDTAPSLTVPEEDKETITYQRGKAKKNALDNAQEDSGLRFDDTVPVEEIHVTPPELQGENQDAYEIIDTKITHRLAQMPGSYVVLKYICPVVKEKASGEFSHTSAPANVLDKSIADVSLLAGLLVDKFLYHLPLYRQHQRIEDCGIKIARSSLTNWVKRCIELLKPIYNTQLDHILLSKVLAIDETPIKSGRAGKGKMKQGYFWPMMGDTNEICFTFSSSRSQRHLFEQLGEFNGTVLSDGYSAYKNYAQAIDKASHAQCWVHTRRYFEKALENNPKGAATALDYIGAIYRHEAIAREKQLGGKDKYDYRQAHIRPIVDAFFSWARDQHQRPDLLPSDEFLKALNYAKNREDALRVFLSDPNVPPDTNHIERALRVVPMGRKNWLFAWTEIGAEHIGIIQSLIVTCRLHGVNPYDYLVDVLQRIDRHPAAKVHELTPRIWKEKFEDNPLRSDVFNVVKNV